MVDASLVSIGQWLKQATAQLNTVDSARLDADLILCHVLDCDRTALYTHPEKKLNKTQLQQLHSLLQRRVQGEPIAYLVQQREFWSLSLSVNENVLVPRPETELVVELAIEHLQKQNKAQTIIDAGTGSGAIAVAISVEWQRLKPQAALDITASDHSNSALALAKQNAATHCPDTINFVHSDWFAAFEDNAFDLILSNPPYLASDDPHLIGNNLAFEPQDALVSGEDGLDAIRSIVTQSIRVGKPEARLVLEHGATQGAQIVQMMQQAAYTQIQTHQDFAGLDRVTSGYCPKN